MTSTPPPGTKGTHMNFIPPVVVSHHQHMQRCCRQSQVPLTPLSVPGPDSRPCYDFGHRACHLYYEDCLRNPPKWMSYQIGCHIKGNPAACVESGVAS